MNANTQQHDENPAGGRSASNGELGFWQDFCCPKCGGGMFGSSKNADGTWTRKCHGNEQWECDYSALESEDSKHFKTFVPNVKGEALPDLET